MMEKLKLQGKKIVIVEDDKFLGGLLSNKLISAGSQVRLVENGGSAMSAIEKMGPNAVILDLLLPDLSGFEVLKKIRANANFKNLPVIVLSNLSEEEDIQHAKDLGVTEFLIKATISMDAVLDRVAKHLP